MVDENLLLGLAYVVAPPLLYLLLLALAIVERDRGAIPSASADTERLLRLKRFGLLTKSVMKIADSDIRHTRFDPPDAAVSEDVKPGEDGLEHLVRLKRKREEAGHARKRLSAP